MRGPLRIWRLPVATASVCANAYRALYVVLVYRFFRLYAIVKQGAIMEEEDWKKAYEDDPRFPCRFGLNCYQKNPKHHGRYKHLPKKVSVPDITSFCSKKQLQCDRCLARIILSLHFRQIPTAFLGFTTF